MQQQILNFQAPVHLDRKGIIESGSFYTPRVLVEEVERMIKPYICDHNRETVIFDSSAGGGAFSIVMNDNFRFADNDKASCDHLAAFSDPSCVFHTNSLQDVCREKFNISEDAYLVQVGNPPYNDTTSAYKNGEKGKNLCDPDLFDRDLGVSFMKSYDKMRSDLVCVLHPLAYLIKKTNFRRLRNFAANYQLRDSVVFSSKLFKGTGNAKFPIVIALYERAEEGMDHEFIERFPFRIWGQDQKKFCLNNFQTTDGYISKYPPRKNDIKTSPIGLYYYTFRDINSVKRSASFQTESHYNAIVVTPENLFHYAYLFAFKSLFKPKDIWLYGNLSPLMNQDYIEKNQDRLVHYAMAKHPAFKELEQVHLELIRKHYSLPGSKMNDNDVVELETELTHLFEEFTEH